MPPLSQKLRQIERAAQRLTRDRRQAVGLRKKVESRLTQNAKQARRPQQAALSEQQQIKKLITSGRADWVNDPALRKAVLVERGTGCVILGLNRKVIAARTRVLKPAPAINRSTFLQHLKKPRVENFVSHMYLDSKGNVTVGIGQLLRTVSDAQALAFTRRGTTTGATPQEIANDFNNVKNAGLPPGTAWPAFRSLTRLDFSERRAEQLALVRMNEFLRLIRGSNAFPEFDSYPSTVKMGILDLAYTLGVMGTTNKFPQFTAAVRRRNWKHASFHSYRRDVSVQRNGLVQIWFDVAARRSQFFISHKNCKKDLVTLSR